MIDFKKLPTICFVLARQSVAKRSDVGIVLGFLSQAEYIWLPCVQLDQQNWFKKDYMEAADQTLQALRKEVSVLTLRLKELGEENRDLREICNESAIQYVERLAAHRHKRYFAHVCDKLPIRTTANVSDLQGAAPIVRGIA